MPRSASRGRPAPSNMMFSGLRSRCTTPLRCAASSASATYAATATASRIVNRPFFASRSETLPPETYSMLM